MHIIKDSQTTYHSSALGYNPLILYNGTGAYQDYYDDYNSYQDVGYTVYRQVSNDKIVSNSTEIIRVSINNFNPKNQFLVGVGFLNLPEFNVTPISYSTSPSPDTYNFQELPMGDHTVYQWFFESGFSPQVFNITIFYTIHKTIPEATFKPMVYTNYKELFEIDGEDILTNSTQVDAFNESVVFNTSNNVNWTRSYGREYFMTLYEVYIPKIGPTEPAETCAVLCHSYLYSTSEDFVDSQRSDRASLIGVLNWKNTSVVIPYLETEYQYDPLNLSGGAYNWNEVRYNMEYNQPLTDNITHDAINHKYSLNYSNALGYSNIYVDSGSYDAELYHDTLDENISVNYTIQRKVENNYAIGKGRIQVVVDNTEYKNNFNVEISFRNTPEFSAVPTSYSDNASDPHFVNVITYGNYTKYTWVFDSSISPQVFNISIDYNIYKIIGDIDYKPKVRSWYNDLWYENHTINSKVINVNAVIFNESATFTSANNIDWTEVYGRDYWTTMEEVYATVD